MTDKSELKPCFEYRGRRFHPRKIQLEMPVILATERETCITAEAKFCPICGYEFKETPKPERNPEQ